MRGQRLPGRPRLFQARAGDRGPAAGSYQVGRLTGRQSLVFSRSLAAPDGAIRGVVFAAMDVRALADSLRGASAVPGASVQLVDRAAVVLATSDEQAERADTPGRRGSARRRARAPQRCVAGPGRWARRCPLRAAQAVQASAANPLFVVAAVPALAHHCPCPAGPEVSPGGHPGHGARRRRAGLGALGQRAARPLGQLIAGLRHVEAEDYARALSQPRTSLRELDDLQRSLGSWCLLVRRPSVSSATRPWAP